jgi:hypothetical protein
MAEKIEQRITHTLRRLALMAQQPGASELVKAVAGHFSKYRPDMQQQARHLMEHSGKRRHRRTS